MIFQPISYSVEAARGLSGSPKVWKPRPRIRPSLKPCRLLSLIHMQNSSLPSDIRCAILPLSTAGAATPATTSPYETESEDSAASLVLRDLELRGRHLEQPPQVQRLGLRPALCHSRHGCSHHWPHSSSSNSESWADARRQSSDSQPTPAKPQPALFCVLSGRHWSKAVHLAGRYSASKPAIGSMPHVLQIWVMLGQLFDIDVFIRRNNHPLIILHTADQKASMNYAWIPMISQIDNLSSLHTGNPNHWSVIWRPLGTP